MRGVTIWTSAREGNPKKKAKTCYRCGLIDHFGCDPQCPSCKRQDPQKMSGEGSFWEGFQSIMFLRSEWNPVTPSMTMHSVSMTEGDHSELTAVQIGGVGLKMLIDSGANSKKRLLMRGHGNSWRQRELSVNHRMPLRTKSYSYASNRPLPVKVSYKCTMGVCDRSTRAEARKGWGVSLLGKTTATELGVLKVGINIAVVITKAKKLKQQYQDVFEGAGKWKNKQMSLDIDPTEEYSLTEEYHSI